MRVIVGLRGVMTRRQKAVSPKGHWGDIQEIRQCLHPANQ